MTPTAQNAELPRFGIPRIFRIEATKNMIPPTCKHFIAKNTGNLPAEAAKNDISPIIDISRSIFRSPLLMSDSVRASQVIANTRENTSSPRSRHMGAMEGLHFEHAILCRQTVQKLRIPKMQIVMEMWSPVGQLAGIKGIGVMKLSRYTPALHLLM